MLEGPHPPQVPCLALAHVPSAMAQTGDWMECGCRHGLPGGQSETRRGVRGLLAGAVASALRGAGRNRDTHPETLPPLPKPALAVTPPSPPTA